MKTSWKTTLCGALAAAIEGASFFVSPEFVPFIHAASMLLTSAGLFFARDHNVSSEAAGIK